jgi:hypothetical protein
MFVNPAHDSHVTLHLTFKERECHRWSQIPLVILFMYGIMSDNLSDYNVNFDISHMYELVVGPFNQCALSIIPYGN